MALNGESAARWSPSLFGVKLGEYNIFPGYRMWNTRTVMESTDVEHLIDNVASVADSAPDHYLRVLVINAHGSAGYLALGSRRGRAGGGPGIRGLLPSFGKWKGKIANIWINACEVAGQRETPMTGPVVYNDGNLFCSGLAKLTGAYVVASMDEQPLLMAELPFGHVPDFSGRVFRWEPDHGSVDWFRNYGVADESDPPAAMTPPPIAIPPRFLASQKAAAGTLNFRPVPIHVHLGL